MAKSYGSIASSYLRGDCSWLDSTGETKLETITYNLFLSIVLQHAIPRIPQDPYDRGSVSGCRSTRQAIVPQCAIWQLQVVTTQFQLGKKVGNPARMLRTKGDM
jgi:hypothetical protein